GALQSPRGTSRQGNGARRGARGAPSHPGPLRRRRSHRRRRLPAAAGPEGRGTPDCGCVRWHRLRGGPTGAPRRGRRRRRRNVRIPQRVEAPGRLMLFTDLLRLTVLLVAGEATALGAIAVVIANREDDVLTLIVAAGCGGVAAAVGVFLGRAGRAADGMSRTLAGARVATTLPPESSLRIDLVRLWPLGAFALIAGGVGWLVRQVPAIGAGYALLVALMWRSREAAVTGVEDRDEVRFYVEPSSALEPIKLVRTP